jgi:hypothetical protein
MRRLLVVMLVIGLLAFAQGPAAMAQGSTHSPAPSMATTSLKSDTVLEALRPGLEALRYDVEASKSASGRIRRPVLFGSRGMARVAYDVDAVHDELGIVMEIEAGRGARSNAAYRDVIRASLIVEARFFVLGLAGTHPCARVGSRQRLLRARGQGRVRNH